MSDNDRITNLEIALAHNEGQIETLSDMVARQWKEIDLLKKRLERADARISELNASIKDKSEGEGDTISDMAAAEKPPHY